MFFKDFFCYKFCVKKEIYITATIYERTKFEWDQEKALRDEGILKVISKNLWDGRMPEKPFVLLSGIDLYSPIVTHCLSE